MKGTKTVITILRMAIGWHLLYEGISKLWGHWTAASYLNNAQGFMASFYHWLAADSLRLTCVDILNTWGLILVGLALTFGALITFASICGAVMLLLYYFAYPPFGASLLTGESSVYFVNQLLIEALALIFIACYKEKGYGMNYFIDKIRLKSKKHREEKQKETEENDAEVRSRREMLKNLAVLPFIGVTGWFAYKDSSSAVPDALSGSTIQIDRKELDQLKGAIPTGKLGKYDVSRLILGGNLFDGTAHARDLLYVSSLFRAYNTEKKIFETLILAEEAGINTVAVSDWVVESKMLTRYRKLTGSKIKILVYHIFNDEAKKYSDEIKRYVDMGVDIIQVHGTIGDRHVLNNHVEIIGEYLDAIRSNGVVAGLAAHDIHAFIECQKQGIVPDYYFKTMHHDHYWSAHPRENRRMFEMSAPDRLKSDHNLWHDNLFDTFPDMTLDFIKNTTVPVVGFKVLAGGAISPEDGFKYAFENGADFICAGMFDFQIVKDVNICIDTLNNLKNRTRPWYA